MSKETKVFLGIIVGLVVIIGGSLIINTKTPGKYDDFAQCLKDSGTKFYGAYWCPHCAAQKALFGKSAKKLPYIECALSQDKQTQICIDNKIESYPTWELKDGTRLQVENSSGVSLETLAAKTSCALPN